MPPQVVQVKDSSKLAQALANEKCMRILEHLEKHEDATESQLSKSLSIPLSTVHYNMKILVDAQLVYDKEYSYSSRGKEVTHYKLNRNPIVILPQDTPLSSLRALVPAAILAAGIGVAYWLATRAPVVPSAAPMMAKTAEAGAEVAADSAVIMFEAAPAMMQATQPNVLPWFLAGVAITLVLAFLAMLIQKRWSKSWR